MMIYAGILFVTAAIFGIVAALIYCGKTDLIHDYHRTRVTDKLAYGKAFGRALGVFAAAMVVSGGIALFGDSPGIVYSSVAVLVTGLAGGIAALVRVQKKYNGGVF